MSANNDSKFKNWLVHHSLVVKVQEFLREISPWGVEGMNLYDVLRFFVTGLINGSVSIRSAAISFRLLVAVFPAIILLLSILPYTPLKAEDIIDVLRIFFPGDTVTFLSKQYKTCLTKLRGRFFQLVSF